jgi:hypothetical protein
MLFPLATKIIHEVAMSVTCSPVTFVSPVISTTLAAATVRMPDVKSVQFGDRAGAFAAESGLAAILAGEQPSNERGSGQGLRYSKLTKLHTAEDVDCCNSVIVDLLTEQLPGTELAVARIGAIVGELHDNVASHANGAGYSAAQVYNRRDGKHIEFAVADCGCGMLHNVRRVKPEIIAHRDAIQWCLGYRNTTAAQPDEWAQRIPTDCAISPFPASTGTFIEESHHLGLGLWKLTELVKEVSGGLWIWSGNSQLTYLEGKMGFRSSSVPWEGVAIEASFNVDKVREALARMPVIVDQQAGRWGL